MSEQSVDSSSVAVIYGRDSAASEGLLNVLARFGLRPVTWGSIVDDMGMGTAASPLVVVGELFKRARAAVVLLTPDDEARLRRALRRFPGDENVSFQPRQNVLFEAGMAAAIFETRTVIVRIGDVSAATDLTGVRILNLDGDRGSLDQLRRRLQSAGCAVIEGDNTGNAEMIKAAIERQNIEVLQSGSVFSQNERNVTLADALESLGLRDVENRQEDRKTLPPHEFYQRAKREVVITGLSAHSTFTQHSERIEDLLSQNKKVFVLIMHPDASDELSEIHELEKHPVEADIRTVIRIIAARGLDHHRNFHIRFLRRRQPFTAVMIDGDIEYSGSGISEDAGGEIRVQPSLLNGTQHQGMVFRFVKVRDGGFDYFASDLRAQWRKAERYSDLGMASDY